jgi:hypothetical protein
MNGPVGWANSVRSDKRGTDVAFMASFNRK